MFIGQNNRGCQTNTVSGSIKHITNKLKEKGERFMTVHTNICCIFKLVYEMTNHFCTRTPNNFLISLQIFIKLCTVLMATDIYYKVT
jgi:hypothetical protein